jgi:cyclopropane fatty-acyl-phospholipid synthase-like methyltransferase
MPYSDPTNKPWTIEKLKEINPRTVLDVGAGSGTYIDIIREHLGSEVYVEAVEVWEPYIKEFKLESKYGAVWNRDVREFKVFPYDLVIFGDILEHMTEAEAVELWEKVSQTASYAIISIPIVHYHQGAEFGNPYEVHVEEDWNTERVLQKFKNIVEYAEFPQTGVFVAKFKEME